MFFGKGNKGVTKTVEAPIPVELAVPQDPNAWVTDNAMAEILLMKTVGIQFMCIFAYAIIHGSKVFSAIGDSASISYKFISLIFSCTGGGIIVPILINGIPSPLANDMYLIAIIVAFLIHHNYPVIREVLNLSGILKVIFIILYETTRAASVAKLTYLAAEKISPSMFSFPLVGPIICGTIGGCGGAFLPLSKGLEPIKMGLLPPMTTALIAASSFHLFMNSSYRDGVINAKEKAQINIALFFIATGLLSTTKEKKKVTVSPVKKER